MSLKKPWKKNLRKIPENIWVCVNSFSRDECVVACVKKIDVPTIQSGIFDHIGITWVEDRVEFTKRVVPHPNVGTYSSRNRHGYEIVYREWPKVEKSWSVDAPNYGDWYKGSHEVVFSKQVYQREFVAPKLLALQIEQIGKDIREQSLVFRFTIEETLDRQSPEFAMQLLFNLNLLQENTGNHSVYESDVTIDEYLNTLYVNWEILPPGEREETITRILSGFRTQDPKIRATIEDRYDFLTSLQPRNYIQGINEFRRYFGAQFKDDFVLFENLEYGNAIYVMFENWEELSKKSRTELISSRTQEDFIRIPHTKTWKRRLTRIINREKLKRQL